MTSEDYANEIALPAIRNMLANRADRLANYSAVILTYHLTDYLAADSSKAVKDIEDRICSVATPTMEVLKGICNGTKHAGNRSGYKFKPGSERHFPVFAFDVPGSGFDVSRLEVSGLGVDYNEQTLFLDFCAQFYVQCCKFAYPDQLGNIDISFFDRYVLDHPPVFPPI